MIFDFGNADILESAAVMTPHYDDNELVEQVPRQRHLSGFYDINNLLDGGMSNDRRRGADA